MRHKFFFLKSWKKGNLQREYKNYSILSKCFFTGVSLHGIEGSADEYKSIFWNIYDVHGKISLSPKAVAMTYMGLLKACFVFSDLIFTSSFLSKKSQKRGGKASKNRKKQTALGDKEIFPWTS